MAADTHVGAVRRPFRWAGHPAEALTVTMAITLIVLVGALIGHGLTVQVVGLAGLTAGFVVGLKDWRRSVYGLLVYLPFSGVANVLMYPRTATAVLLKDFLFVIPAYAGFLVSSVTTRRSSSFGGAPRWLLISFTAIVVAQAFNPALPNRVVGMIGAKIWLFYIPMCILGYHLVQDRRDLHRLLGVMSAAAAIPALVGIVEAVLIYAGHGSLVYGAYGQAAASVTQDFAEFDLAGGGSLRRVPSTFAFVAQFFAFTVSMVAVTYAWWRGVLEGRRLASFGFVLWLLVLLAGFLSGARGAIAFIPVLVVLIVVLERPRLSVLLKGVVGPVALLGGAATIFGTGIGGLLSHVAVVATEHFRGVFLEGLHKVYTLTLTGLGTGIDTNPARYAFTQPGLFTMADGTWYESWYVKALLELGVAGLVIVGLLLAAILVRGLRQHVHLRDPRLKTISACLLAVLIWNVIYNIKSQYMDIDPMNIYFWLFVGVLAKLAVLDKDTSTAAGHGDN